MANTIQSVLPSTNGGYNSSGNELTLEQRVIYDRNLLSRLLPNLVFLPYGQPRPMPRNAGQSVQFRRFTSLDVPSSPLLEGVTPDPEDLTIEQVVIVPAQYGSFVQITDVVDMTAPDPVLLEAGALLGEQAAHLLDTKVREELSSATNVQYVGGKTKRTDVAAELSCAEILLAVKTMHENKIGKLTSILDASTGVGTKPIAGGYIAIIDAATLYDLKTESSTKFVPVHEYGSGMGALLPFEVGAVDEVRFVLSHNTKVYASGGAGSEDVHETIILGREAFGVVTPQGVQNIVKGFGAGDDPLNQRMTSGWKAYFGVELLQPLAILRIEHLVNQ